MATVPDIVTVLLNAQRSVGPVLGSDVMTADRQTYVVNLTNLAFHAVIIKTVTDNAPPYTLAMFQTTLNHALDGTWPGWVVDPAANPPPL